MNVHATAHPFRPPTVFERSKQQQPLPENVQPELSAVSVPTPHPPSPPLSGDESGIVKTLPHLDGETVSTLPILHTPPSNEFPLIVPVPPAVFQSPVEIPAPSISTDDISDKGKQKDIDPYVEAFPPKEHGPEGTVCETETEPEEKLNEWELVDKDEAPDTVVVTASEPPSSSGVVYEVELEDKGTTLPDIQEEAVLSSPAVAHPVGAVVLDSVAHVDVAIQAPETPTPDIQTLPLEPRRLEEEEAPIHIAAERADEIAVPADISFTPKTDLEVVPTVPLVNGTIKGESKADVHVEADSVEETAIEQFKREEGTEHHEAEAPVLEEVTLTSKGETITEVPTTDSPAAPVELEAPINREIATPEAVGETVPEGPKADIPIAHVAQEQGVQDLTPNVESEEATETLTLPAPVEPGKLDLEGAENQSDTHLPGEVSVIEVHPDESTQVSDDDSNRVPSVSPRIPTPQLTEKSLDWDNLVEEICKEHDSDFKGEITALPVPEHVVVAPGPSTLSEDQAPLLSTPQTPPTSYDGFATPSLEVQYIPPPPIPPRRIEDEEKQPEEEKNPEIIVDVSELPQSTVPDVIATLSPPGPASLLSEEIQPRMRSRTPSLLSRPSLADIREEVGNEDAEPPVAPPRQEPVLTEVLHPVEIAKPVVAEVTSVRKIEDEMANPEQSEKLEDKGKGIAADSDSEDAWIPKHKETDSAPPQGSAPPESPGPAISAETPNEGEEKPKADAPSIKEKTGLRKLARTFSFGGSKSPISEIRPGTSHSAAVSIDHDRRSIAESTTSTRNKFMKTKKLFTLGLAKDKEKKENAQPERPATADKAPSVKSATTSPTSETPPSPKPERRNTRDLMKLAIGRSKKKEAESTPSSPVDGKKMSMSNAVNLIMMKKKAQEEKVRHAEAQQAEAQQAAAAVAAAKSAPPPADVPEIKESVSAPSVPSPADAPEVQESVPPPAAAEATTEVSPPPTPIKRRNTLTMNSAMNLVMRRKAKEEQENDKPTSVAPTDGSAIVSNDQVTAAPIETQVEATAPTMKRRGSLSMNKAVDLMMLRKKVKEDKADDKVDASAVGPAVDNAAVDTGIQAEVSPPPTPSKRMSMNKAMDLMMLRKGKDKEKEKEDKEEDDKVDTPPTMGSAAAVDTGVPAEVSPPPTPSKRITMNKAMDLMMLRKGKDKEKEKETDDSSSSPDADSSANPKKDKRITVGNMFGRKKSSQNSPNPETSNTRPVTPSSPTDNGVALASPSGLESPSVAHTTTTAPPKPSRAPSVYSVDQRPGTSASMKKFGALFKKRTPSVYSKDVPDSPSPFNAPGSPFPTANGTDRSPVASDTDDDVKKSKLNRRWSIALGGRTKSSGKLVPGSSSGEAATDRPPTGSSVHVHPLSPPAGSKIPVATVPVTSGTVPATPPAASADKSRPKLASRAKTFMAFSKKK